MINCSFVQSSSWNTLQGDESIVSARISTRSNYQWNFTPCTFRTTFTTLIGGSYRADSIPQNAFRLSDNEAFAEAIIVLPLGWMVNPYASANFRTPLTESFAIVGGQRIRTANLWDPVTSQQALGGTYFLGSKTASWSSRLGFTLQQLRAHYHTQQTNDVRTPEIEAYKAQSGVEWVNEMSAQIDSSLTYTGRFGMFGSFDDVRVWAVRSENELRVKVWKFIGVTWNFTVVQDVRQTRRTQIRQSLTLGIMQDF
ncbi:MAG: hypothetical protein IPM61_16185 [Chlorobi bacterium]|nr:hypothetical protein [Chlorobiota bacterium]MBX7218008.1 hypothetical protein [Candidatus Kapabacteria bacterium]